MDIENRQQAQLLEEVERQRMQVAPVALQQVPSLSYMRQKEALERYLRRAADQADTTPSRHGRHG